MKRIAILGPESTGKSTLAAALAEALGTRWVPEYARQYLEQNGPAYTETDVLKMAHGQLKAEEVAATQATHEWLVCDTELTVFKIWCEHAYGRLDPWLMEQWRSQTYHHYFLTNIDIPWQDDPLREHPHLRQHLFDWYYRELTLAGWPFTVISGSPEERLAQCLGILAKS